MLIYIIETYLLAPRHPLPPPSTDLEAIEMRSSCQKEAIVCHLIVVQSLGIFPRHT
jgi:hypothetical protein